VKRVVDETSVRQVEELSGVSRTVIHDFVGGRTPQKENLRELERWAQSAGLLTGGGTPQQEAPASIAEAREAYAPAAAWRVDGRSEETEGAGREPGAARLLAEEDRMEREAAALRAHALNELATAERIYAEATKIRAEALAAQSRISEKDSDRAREVRSPERLIAELSSLPASLYDVVRAGFLDRLREQESAAAAKGEGSGERRERTG